MKLRHRITAVARREIRRLAAITTARAAQPESIRAAPRFRLLTAAETAVYHWNDCRR
jgi:hypothetical protein